MKIITEEIHINSKGNSDMIDITERVSEILHNSKLNEGFANLFVVGSTEYKNFNLEK